MAIRIRDLAPGIEFEDPNFGRAVFIACVPQHPIYPGLCMVIWWLENERRYSFDALRPHQVLDGWIVIDAYPLGYPTHEQLQANLRRVLTPGA